MTERLRMSGIGKSFGGVEVLSAVDFAVGGGEVVGLLGANGAGKSTLMKILSGVYTMDAGEIVLDGRPIQIHGPIDAIAHGIRLLPQELSVHPDMTIAENMFVADPLHRRVLGLRLIDRKAMNARARAILSDLGLGHVDPAWPMKRLRAPEQRVVEIARAIAGEARVLIMDEPTAALSEQETRLLFDVLRRLAGQGVSVVYISHYLDEVFEICQRIVVLRDGRNAGDFPAATSTHQDVLRAMLGNVVTDLYPPRAQTVGDPMLEVEGLSVGRDLRGIDFSVRRGEIFGVFGLIGSGLDQLGRGIYGALGHLEGGGFRIDGERYVPSDVRTANRAGIGFIAAERKREGIVGDLTVRENITLPFLDRFMTRGVMQRPAERRHVNRWIGDLSIRTRGPEQPIRTLSGGNQQKVCIARWLMEGVKLLILEEPTRGVDIGARKEIYGKLRDLADRGLALLVISSDVEEIAGLADRGLVLDRGEVAVRFEGPQDPTALMHAAAGGARRTDRDGARTEMAAG